MPIHNGSGCDENERRFPSSPQPSQHDPKHLVPSRESTARSFDVQRQQLLAESQIFQNEVLTGTESTENPTEKMAKSHDHGPNFTGTRGTTLLSK